MPRDQDWSALFSTAFHGSRNAMVLADGRRIHVDFNGAYLKLLGQTADALRGRPLFDVVVGGPAATDREWAAAIAGHRFDGTTELRRADGGVVAVQWAATSEIVTGRRLVLFVALSTARWGRAFRGDHVVSPTSKSLTPREREVVQLVALGLNGPEIADELHIAHDTVRTHVRNAMAKCGARSRAHLVAKALGDGLVLG
jgi:PAS domain S-box-containing protein